MQNKDVDKSQFNVGPRYEVRKILGYGTYGVVAECHDTVTKETVAIKRLHRVEDLV